MALQVGDTVTVDDGRNLPVEGRVDRADERLVRIVDEQGQPVAVVRPDTPQPNDPALYTRTATAPDPEQAKVAAVQEEFQTETGRVIRRAMGDPADVAATEDLKKARNSPEFRKLPVESRDMIDDFLRDRSAQQADAEAKAKEEEAAKKEAVKAKPVVATKPKPEPESKAPKAKPKVAPSPRKPVDEESTVPRKPTATEAEPVAGLETAPAAATGQDAEAETPASATAAEGETIAGLPEAPAAAAGTDAEAEVPRPLLLRRKARWLLDYRKRLRQKPGRMPRRRQHRKQPRQRASRSLPSKAPTKTNVSPFEAVLAESPETVAEPVAEQTPAQRIAARKVMKKWKVKAEGVLEGTKAVTPEGYAQRVFHGTGAAYDAVKAKTGSDNFYFTTNPEVASGFATERRLGESEKAFENRAPNVRPSYLKMDNPLVVDAKGAKWNKIKDGGGKEVSTSELAVRSWTNKHDGLIVKNVREGHDESQVGDTYIAFKENQIVPESSSGVLNYAQPVEETAGRILRDHKTQVEREIREIASRIAPQVEVRVTEPGAGPVGREFTEADGRHIVEVALAGDPTKTVRHEAVHALRTSGLFTKQEWGGLLKAARSDGWLDKHKIKDQYPELHQDGKPTMAAYEEAVAEEFASWAQGKTEAKGATLNLFQRMLKFFRETVREPSQSTARHRTPITYSRLSRAAISAARDQTGSRDGVRERKVEFADAESEARWQEASKGVTAKRDTLGRIKDAIVQEKNRLTRYKEHIPNDAYHSDAREKMLHYDQSEHVSKQNIANLFDRVMGKVKEEDVDLMTRKMVLDDLLWSSEEGMALPFGLKSTDDVLSPRLRTSRPYWRHALTFKPVSISGVRPKTR